MSRLDSARGAPASQSAMIAMIAMIDEAFERRAWHGPSLRASLRGVTARQAEWRPARGRHNIWELTVHIAYWKHLVRRRITGEKRGSFPYGGSNWFERPGGAALERSWKDDIRLLVEEHRVLRTTILALPARALAARVHGRDTAAFTIRGVAAHDLYHAGQIQLLKRLQRQG